MLDKESYILSLDKKYPNTNKLIRHLHYDKYLCTLTQDNLFTLSLADIKTFYQYIDYNNHVFLGEVDEGLFSSNTKYYSTSLPPKLTTIKSKKPKVIELNLAQCFALARLTPEFYNSNTSACIKLTELFCKEWRPVVWKKIESYLV